MLLEQHRGLARCRDNPHPVGCHPPPVDELEVMRDQPLPRDVVLVEESQDPERGREREQQDEYELAPRPQPRPASTAASVPLTEFSLYFSGSPLCAELNGVREIPPSYSRKTPFTADALSAITP